MADLGRIPATKYARVDGLRIAYQRSGSGPPTIIVPGLVSNIDVVWQSELYRRIFDHTDGYLDWIHFDKRGMGVSDRFEEPPSIEERVRDIEAIMDDVGWESANIFGMSEGGAMARHFAATRPERVNSVALVGTMVDNGALARAEELSEDAWRPLSEMMAFWLRVADTYGEDAQHFVDSFTPSQRDNPEYVEWVCLLNRLASTPAAFARQLQSMPQLLEQIPDVPPDTTTVIVHGAGDRIIPVGHGRALAEMMPHARYVEVDGGDHFFAASPNWRDYLDPVIETFTGTQPTARTERRFAAVLFTDIVDSTAGASAVGDDTWSDLVASHDRITAKVVAAGSGRVVKSTGDGALAVFDVASLAVDAAQRLRGELAPLGLDVRAGIHAGEIEVHADGDVSGLAVNLAARVETVAAPGEVMVSSTVRDMLLGTGVDLTDRGEHSLKGIDGTWRLYAVTG